MARARKSSPRAGQAGQGKPSRRAAAAVPADAGEQTHRVAPTDLAITHRHAAGIDIHAAEHFVSVPPEDVPAGFVSPAGLTTGRVSTKGFELPQRISTPQRAHRGSGSEMLVVAGYAESSCTRSDRHRHARRGDGNNRRLHEAVA
jgi:hypothetical protein